MVRQLNGARGGECLEMGVRWEPFQRCVDVEIGEDGVAIGAFAGPAFDVIAVDGNGRPARRAKFANAQAGRSSDR
jgi:hypothetical protein